MGFLSGLAGLAGPAASVFSAFQGNRGRNNPSNAASQYLNQIPGFGKEAYNPFIQQGQQAQGMLNPLQNQYAQNPHGIYNDILSQYAPSAGYQYKQNQLTKELGNTAAAGGFAGTENHQNAHGELINALMSGDMQQFLQNILGIQGAGMQGLGQRAGRGYEASGALADYLGSAAGAQAGNAYQGMENRNAARGNVYSSLASLIGGGPGSTSYNIPGHPGVTQSNTPAYGGLFGPNGLFNRGK